MTTDHSARSNRPEEPDNPAGGSPKQGTAAGGESRDSSLLPTDGVTKDNHQAAVEPDIRDVKLGLLSHIRGINPAVTVSLAISLILQVGFVLYLVIEVPPPRRLTIAEVDPQVVRFVVQARLAAEAEPEPEEEEEQGGSRIAAA